MRQWASHHFQVIKLKQCDHLSGKPKKSPASRCQDLMLLCTEVHSLRAYAGLYEYWKRTVCPIYLFIFLISWDVNNGVSRISCTQQQRQYVDRWFYKLVLHLRRGAKKRMSCPPKMQTYLDPSWGPLAADTHAHLACWHSAPSKGSSASCWWV